MNIILAYIVTVIVTTTGLVFADRFIQSGIRWYHILITMLLFEAPIFPIPYLMVVLGLAFILVMVVFFELPMRKVVPLAAVYVLLKLLINAVFFLRFFS